VGVLEVSAGVLEVVVGVGVDVLELVGHGWAAFVVNVGSTCVVCGKTLQ